MAGRARARRGIPKPSNDSAAKSQRYVIVIGGVRIRTISGEAAATTFWRWNQSPDVVMRGDLQGGFFWEWPDSKRTRIEIVPEPGQRSGGHASGLAVPVDDDAASSRLGVVAA